MKNVLLVLVTVLGAATFLEAQPFYLRSNTEPCNFGNEDGACELTDPDMDGTFELTSNFGGMAQGFRFFKIYTPNAIDGQNWFPGGADAWFTHSGGDVIFRFNTGTKQVEAADDTPFTLCAPGEWTGFDANTPMVNVGGNQWCYTVATPDQYLWKPVVCGQDNGFTSWQPNSGERNVNSQNWFIETTAANEQVCVNYDPATGRVFSTAAPLTGYFIRGSATPCGTGNFDLNPGCKLEDPDMDGVFEITGDFGGVAQGRQEFKIYHADTDTWYPGGPNAWFNHNGGDVTFKFYTANGEVEAIEGEPFTLCAPGQWSGFDPNTPMDDMGNGVFCYNVASPGTYEWKPVVCGGFDSWQPNNGERSVNSGNWEVTTIVDNQQFCVTYDLATGRVSPASVTAVPTMGQWGMILFSLIMLALGMVILGQQKMVMAGTQQRSFSLRQLPFDKAFFGKALTLTGVVFVAAFAISITFFGYEMTTADVPGSLLTIPLVAYIALLIRGSESK